MTTVKYASTCDKCGARSPEYTEWPHCRGGGEHVCPECSVSVSAYREDDGRLSTVCQDCEDY